MHSTAGSGGAAAVRAGAAARLQRELGVGPALARLLIGRGLSEPETAAAFLRPSLAQLHAPWRMRGMRAAVDRILAAIADREPMLIYGDYDADGLTATAILHKAIERLGGAAQTYIPHRVRQGYGLHEEAIAAAAQAGVRLAITVDTGVREFAAVEQARALGIAMIITDHHLAEAQVPAALAVLNPRQPGCDYPDKNLSGAGVALKLAQALLQAGGRVGAGEFPPWLHSFLKLAAIGAIADAVPLLGENRVFARFGLAALAGKNAPGLSALLATALPGHGEISARDVAYRLAPRLNAAGRMDRPDLVLELLAADQTRAAELAQRLEALNAERQQVERAMVEAILARLAQDQELRRDAVLVLADAGWHRGVLGIVAARIMEREHKPTLVFAQDGEWAHGSGRAPAGTHLLDLLTGCAALFTRFGGHAQAAGCVLRAEHLPELRRRLNAQALPAAGDGAAPPPGAQQALAPAQALEVESAPAAELELAPEEITLALAREFRQLEPYGCGNPAPQLLTRGLRLLAAPTTLKERHWRLSLAAGEARWEALWWNACAPGAANAPAPLTAGQTLDLIYHLDYSHHERYGERVRLFVERLAGTQPV